MNALTSLKVSHKIIVLMVGLAVGFILIGAAYYVQIIAKKGLQEVEAEAAQYELSALSAHNLQLKMRDIDTRFLRSPETQTLDQHGILKTELQTVSQVITEVGDARAQSEIMQKNLALLHAYDDAFEQASETLQVLGWNENEGIRAILGERAADLDIRLQTEALYAAYASFLTLRRLEQSMLNSPSSEIDAKAEQANRQFTKALRSANISSVQRRELQDRMAGYLAVFNEASIAMQLIKSKQQELDTLGSQLDKGFSELVASAKVYASTYDEQAVQQSNLITAVFTVLVFMVAIGAAVGMFFIYTGIVHPLLHIQAVINRVNKGETEARVKLRTYDEFADLGKAFDNLLDDRIQSLQTQSVENDRLNNSIIDLIRALGSIAKKDLSIKVPVSEDVTGSVADAVNMLTTETADTLRQVIDISSQVESISTALSQQSEVVNKVAESEHTQVTEASEMLDAMARAMNAIAGEAKSANDLANQTINNTRSAQESVNETVSGINVIRESISETEKRIKRLGERSQEITSIVNLINSIAERTHILALNASMHAASAGEAGKGFAVVAEEVQRLAENAREATSDISLMVNNIRVETSDTVTTMNKLITQVTDGTSLAEQAGKRMKETEQSTEQLVEKVQRIAQSSVRQAKASNTLRDKASTIRQYTEQTGAQLKQQRQHTEELLQFAKVLVERVNVFTLPAITAPQRLEQTAVNEPVLKHA